MLVLGGIVNDRRDLDMIEGYGKLWKVVGFKNE